MYQIHSVLILAHDIIAVFICCSAMYNVFVDEDVLSTIHEVASRLAASAVSSAEWASTELGSFVLFADERSQVFVIPGDMTELVTNSM